MLFLFSHLKKIAWVAVGLRGFILGEMGWESVLCLQLSKFQNEEDFQWLGEITSLLESMTFPLYFGSVSLENSLVMLSPEGVPTVWALCWVWGGHTDWYNDPIKDHYQQPCICFISLSYTWSSADSELRVPWRFHWTDILTSWEQGRG